MVLMICAQLISESCVFEYRKRNEPFNLEFEKDGIILSGRIYVKEYVDHNVVSEYYQKEIKIPYEDIEEFQMEDTKGRFFYLDDICRFYKLV